MCPGEILWDIIILKLQCMKLSLHKRYQTYRDRVSGNSVRNQYVGHGFVLERRTIRDWLNRCDATMLSHRLESRFTIKLVDKIKRSRKVQKS